MSRPQSADSVRYGSSSVSRDGGRTRACSRAARGTTQGDTVVPKDLLRNGPSVTYSQDWMSRADQSLTRHTPKTCSVNLLAGTGSPGLVGTPATKPELRLEIEPGRRSEPRPAGRSEPRPAARRPCTARSRAIGAGQPGTAGRSGLAARPAAPRGGRGG